MLSSHPRMIPHRPPKTERITVSLMIIANTRSRFMPTAISIPNSLVRSSTAISMVLTIPKSKASRMMPMKMYMVNPKLLSSRLTSGMISRHVFTSSCGKRLVRSFLTVDSASFCFSKTAISWQLLASSESKRFRSCRITSYNVCYTKLLRESLVSSSEKRYKILVPPCFHNFWIYPEGICIAKRTTPDRRMMH